MLLRVAIQISSPPLPPGRFDARYRLSPSGDWIGQPSSDGVFSSTLFAPIVSIFWACVHVPLLAAVASPTSVSAAAVMRIALDPRSIRFM